MTVLAIDQGTTSTRALEVDQTGSSRIVKVIEHKQSYPQVGWVEHDPDELIANIQECVDSCPNVSTIGIDNQGESCLAWDAETKSAISPVIVWQDNRTQQAIEALKAAGAESTVLEKASLPLDCYFSASKLAWLFKHIPRAQTLYASGRLRLGTTDAYFLDRLTGHCFTDITTASRTSLLNLNSGQWDPGLCELFEVPIDALPVVVSSTGEFGSIESKGRSIPVTASIVDQQASLFGHGCRESGDAKITFGTGAFALVITGDQPFRSPDQGLLPTIAWQLNKQAPVYALDGGVYCAGSAINWARSLGLFDTFEQINQFEGPSAIERGIIFVPALSGLACPYWDRRATGLWIGLSLDTDPMDMVQAVLEGVAMRAAEVINAMNSFIPTGDTISVDGGVIANPYFCQFLANALNKKVVVQEFAELTAIGTARLAGAKINTSRNPEQATIIYQPESDMLRYMDRFHQAVSRSRSWTTG